jgi:DNA modification methylase
MARPRAVRAVVEAKAIHGDCIPRLCNNRRGYAHIISADPPYNQGSDYDSCDDKKSYQEYFDWTRSWMEQAVAALHKHGTLWIFIPDEWVSEIDLLARHVFKLYKQRHVIWAFTFGQASQNNFTKSHCHILRLTKCKTRFTFNPEAIRVPSARQIVYKDSRANAAGKLPDDTWMLLKEQLEPYMTPDKDTWLESRICGTYLERAKHSPNQIPLPIMDRIVLSTSNPGDQVVDLFAGTGGLAEVCLKQGRNYTGYDVSKVCVKAIRARIEKVTRSLA